MSENGSNNRIELPDGNWVEFRSANDLRNKDRDAVLLASDSAEGRYATGLAVVRTLIIISVISWSFPFPVSVESLGELTMQQYDALSDAMDPYRKAMFPSFEPDTDPESPTVPSSE